MSVIPLIPSISIPDIWLDTQDAKGARSVCAFKQQVERVTGQQIIRTGYLGKSEQAVVSPRPSVRWSRESERMNQVVRKVVRGGVPDQ